MTALVLPSDFNLADESVYSGQIGQSKGLVSIDRSEAAALLTDPETGVATVEADAAICVA